MAKKRDESKLMAALAGAVKQIHRGQTRAPLDEALKDAIRTSGLTHYALGKKAGVAPSVIDRFMADPRAGERGGDLRVSTAAKLADALGLELRPR